MAAGTAAVAGWMRCASSSAAAEPTSATGAASASGALAALPSPLLAWSGAGTAAGNVVSAGAVSTTPPASMSELACPAAAPGCSSAICTDLNGAVDAPHTCGPPKNLYTMTRRAQRWGSRGSGCVPREAANSKAKSGRETGVVRAPNRRRNKAQPLTPTPLHVGRINGQPKRQLSTHVASVMLSSTRRCVAMLGQTLSSHHHKVGTRAPPKTRELLTQTAVLWQVA